MLEGHDGTGFMRKGGFQVNDSLLGGLAGMRHFWREAALGEGGAYVALTVVKTIPDPISRRDAEVHVQGAQGFSLVAEADYELYKCPQGVRADARAFEFVGFPDAEGVSAAVVALLAVVAKDAPPATGFLIVVVFSVAVEFAMENERTGHFAVRTQREFQAEIQELEIIL